MSHLKVPRPSSDLVVDPKTGAISRVWYQYIESLDTDVNDFVNNQVLSSMDGSLQTDVPNLQRQIDSLKNELALSSEYQADISTNSKRIDALAVMGAFE